MVAYAKLKTPYISPEEYLLLEEQAETKSEYYDGIIVAMAGADPTHVMITFDTSLAIGNQLRGTSCQAFGGDLRVYVTACNHYYYPDISVACAEPQYQIIQGLRTLLNPTLIIEVLSRSTEADDRNEKYDCYKTIPSLQTYVLVTQERPFVEWYVRRGETVWQHFEAEGLDASILLESIGCELRLADIYARVSFPEAQTETTDNITEE